MPVQRGGSLGSPSQIVWSFKGHDADEQLARFMTNYYLRVVSMAGMPNGIVVVFERDVT
jgi:hypothetical protein